MPTTTLADEGSVVVPMATVLDALEGVISAEEREAILLDLVGVRSEGVAPGDLITADLFNRIMSDINDLALRVSTLEASTATDLDRPNITSVSPDPVQVGEDLEVLGSALNPERLTGLYVGESQVPLSRIRQGSPSRLLFPVPPISGLQLGPISTMVRVDNPAGSVRFPVVVLPMESDDQSVIISALNLSINPDETIQPNTEYQLGVDIRFASTVEQSFRLTPVLTVEDGAGNWTLTPETIEIPVPRSNDTPFTAPLRLSLRTGDEGAASITINAVGVEFPSASDEANLTSEPITVEEDVVLPSNDIVLNAAAIPQSSTDPHSHFDIATRTLTVRNSHDGAVRLDIDWLINQTGQHSVANPSASGGWTVSQPDPWTQTQAGEVHTSSFFITPSTTESSVQITVAGPTGTQPFSEEFTLRRAATLPSN